MTLLVSVVPGHEGFCRTSFTAYDPNYNGRVGFFQVVRRAWWWPFYRAHGKEFIGCVLPGGAVITCEAAVK